AAFVVLERFPLNANGKLDRKQLPKPVFAARSRREPRTPLEHTITEVFAEVLGVESVGMDDSFFELGGTALVATRAASRPRAALRSPLPGVWPCTAPTPRPPAELAARALAEQSGARAVGESAFDVLVPLRPGSGAPLFCFHPFGGIAWSFAGLAAHLDDDRPIYGLQSPALGSDEALPASTE